MAGPKIETRYTITSANNWIPILANTAPGTTVTVTIADGDYFMGESHKDPGSLLHTLWDAINAAGTIGTACTDISLESNHKLKFTFGSDFGFDFYSGTGQAAGSCPLGLILGFNVGIDAWSSGGSCTALYQIGQSWWGDDLTLSSLDATIESDNYGVSANTTGTTAINGHVVRHDISYQHTRSINFTFVPRDKMFGMEYGQGIPAQNLSFEVAGAANAAAYWTRNGNYYGAQGTMVGRVTAGSFPSFTGANGAYIYALGGSTATCASGDFGEIYQYIDLSESRSLSFNHRFVDNSDLGSIQTATVYIGSDLGYHWNGGAWGTSTTGGPTIIDTSFYDGYERVTFRVICGGGAGGSAVANWYFDNMKINRDADETFTVNNALYAAWQQLRRGNPCRYYPDSSDRSIYEVLTLAESSSQNFNPTRVDYAVNRFDLALEFVEYVA